MKIIALVENTTCNDALTPEHGLSLLIEYAGSRILFDAGPSRAFAVNADKLGVDLASVDFAVLSHGHFDHAGGLIEFFGRNATAPVYMKQAAAGGYHAVVLGVAKRYVGVDRTVFSEYGDRIRFLENETEPIAGCHIITNIDTVPQYQLKNRYLYELKDNKLTKDEFRHELMLVFEEEDGIVAITGCSHNGIVSLLETAKKRFPGKAIKAAVGGFHLIGMMPNTLGCSKRYLGTLADKLSDYRQFYTCHCTGTKAYNILKEKMGDQLNQLQTGMTISV